MLLLKVYGQSELTASLRDEKQSELTASLRDGNGIGSFRICLKIFNEWELKKKEILGSFEEQVISLAV